MSLITQVVYRIPFYNLNMYISKETDQPACLGHYKEAPFKYGVPKQVTLVAFPFILLI